MRDYSPMHVKIAPARRALRSPREAGEGMPQRGPVRGRASRPCLIRAFEMVLASQVADAIGIMPQRR
jgi:hypothetical protein